MSFLYFLFFSCSDSTTDSATTISSSKPLGTADSWSQQELTRMEQQVQNSDPLQNINEIEDIVADIESEVLLQWQSSWKEGDPSFYKKLLQSNAGVDWNTTCQESRSIEQIVEYSCQPSQEFDSAQEYLSSFSKIDSVQFDIVDAQLTESGIQTRMRFQLRGLSKSDGQRQHDRGHMTVSFVSVENEVGEQWKISSIKDVLTEKLRAQRAPIFEDVTAEWKLDSVPIENRKEAIRRGGYALAAVDYDGDGKSDLLIGHHGSMQLLKNTGNSFIDVTKEEGLDGERVVKSAAIADMDGDGDKDILALRFVEATPMHARDFVAYENMGEGASPRFVARKDLLPRSLDYDRAMPLTLADFNNDGTLDIYIGFPGIRDFTSGISNRERTDNQASQGMWLNKGNWKFEETTTGIAQDNSVYAHAAMASDLDGDGQVELLVVDDSGRINPMYKQDETGNFVNVAEQSGFGNTGYSMGITTGDFNADGLLDIMSTNVTLNAGDRILRLAETVEFDDSRYQKNFSNMQKHYEGLMLFQNNGDGTFSQVQDTALRQWSGEAAAAGEWIDYNHDGLLDYYIPNGLWSSGAERLGSLFFRSDITTFPDPLYTGIKTQEQLQQELGAYMMVNDVHGGSNYVAPSSQEVANPVLRLLRHYRNDSGALALSLGGYQHNSLFRNNGDGTFTEVGYLENADRIEDGYIVAAVDIDNDGRQDLVLRNTDPALEHTYPPVVALRNVQQNASTACVYFDGSKNPYGARVYADVNGKRMVREIRSVNGAVQAEPMALFGLGTATSADNVEIHWPDGNIEKLGTITNCSK